MPDTKPPSYIPFIVTVFDMKDLDSLYEDLETEGKTPQNISILRKVECINRRTISRSTHYLLSLREANALKKDPRVKSVELDPKIKGIQPELYASEQDSNYWDKSTTTESEMLNWGLLRCYEGQNRLNWGTDNSGQNSFPSYLSQVSGKINLTQTGKNVDVVIIDDNSIVWNHPEFENAQGQNRTIQYDWGQHNEELGLGPNTPYVYGQPQMHSTHVTGTACGKTQGWARDANIYNIDYTNNEVIDYVRAFHNNKPINPETGRKNPTIVNNSWGYSLPRQYWQWDQVTAVTYRGVRYTPNGETIRKGNYGIEVNGRNCGNFINLENGGNRIILDTANDGFDPLPPIPTFVSHPTTISWSPVELWGELFGDAYYFYLSGTEPDWQEYLTNTQIFEVVYQGSGVLDVSWTFNIDITFVDPAWAWLQVTAKITVLDNNDNIVKEITKFQNSGVYPQTNLEINIWEFITLDNSVNYTLRFEKIITKNVPPEGTVSIYESIDVNPYAFSFTVADVSSIPLNLLGAQNLTESTVPDINNPGTQIWYINLPFSINLLPDEDPTTKIWLNGSNKIDLYSDNLTGFTLYFAHRPGSFWGYEDNSIQRIYYGTENTAPNRTFRIRVEATTSNEGILGSPDLLYEITLYENLPGQIDFHVGQNSDKIIGGLFDFDQLLEWGLQQNKGIPVRIDALDSDIEAAIQDGIIFVGAAGNESWKMASPGDIDWDNSVEMADRYPWSVNYPIYYMRGTSPTANDNSILGNYDIPNICVGATEITAIDRKAGYSNCGPGVDLYAPGSFIISSTPPVLQFGAEVSVAHPEDSQYRLFKLFGTSMASPQVAGVLACALEIYPNMNQVEAKNYILSYATNDQLTIYNETPVDYSDIQGSANKFLYYKKERETTGNNFPKLNYKPRLTSGFVYPRTRIRRK